MTHIAAGQFHNLFIKSDGSLWVMGYNNDGQLGNQTFNNANLPQEIVSNNVTAIAGGDYHTLFVKSDGSLWAMGLNTDGELGDGSLVATNMPEMIVPSNVTAVAACGQLSFFLKTDGSFWAMGDTGFGELGDGSHNHRIKLPEMIVPSNVTAIACGEAHSLFLKSDGSLWAMGYNAYGQLGDRTFNLTTNMPEMIVPSDVTAIAAGFDHSLFLKSDGSLWAMGQNYDGQLGDGTASVNGSNNMTAIPEMVVPGGVVAIAAGSAHSLFIKSDGSLWGMGDNGSGELEGGTHELEPRTKRADFAGRREGDCGRVHRNDVRRDRRQLVDNRLQRIRRVGRGVEHHCHEYSAANCAAGIKDCRLQRGVEGFGGERGDRAIGRDLRVADEHEYGDAIQSVDAVRDECANAGRGFYHHCHQCGEGGRSAAVFCFAEGVIPRRNDIRYIPAAERVAPRLTTPEKLAL